MRFENGYHMKKDRLCDLDGHNPPRHCILLLDLDMSSDERRNSILYCVSGGGGSGGGGGGGARRSAANTLTYTIL